MQTDVVIRAIVTKQDGIAYYGASFVRVTIGAKIGVRMSDLISRQAALDAVNDCGICIQKILDIPSAEPKKGRWQRRKDEDCWECSECHAVLENDDLGMHNFYFCYHCGANMMDKLGYMDIEEAHYE